MNSFAHFIFLFRDSGEHVLNITGNVMCLFHKLCSMSHNLADGELKKAGQELKRKRWSDVSLEEKPTPLRFYAYCLTPFGSFGNPFIEYKLFEYALNCGNRDKISDDDRQLAFSKYFWSFPHSIAQLFLLPNLTEGIYFSDFYLNRSLLVKLLLMVLFTLCQLARYGPSWYAIEAGFIGLGLNANEIIPGDECMNLDYSYVLSAPNCQEWMRRLNHTTHVFFKNYFYTRLLHEGYGSVFVDSVIFACSSSWHGFGPQLYPMIIETVFIMNVDKELAVRYPLDLKGSPWNWGLWKIWTVLEMTYIPCSFYFPSLHAYFGIRNSFQWAPMVLAVIVGTICQFAKRRAASQGR
jgi:hypothetical protein